MDSPIPEMSSLDADAIKDGKIRTRIDGHTLIRMLGQGGEGEVWLAMDVLKRHEVAIKVFWDSGSTSEAARDRFLKQIRLASKLEHRHIARIYHCVDKPHCFFSMEFVKGKHLDVFAVEANLDRRGILELFIKICEAVSYAHQSLVVHLDLKPSNILVDEKGEPHVLDFGLAMALSEDGGWEKKKLEGTPEFMSPEQARRSFDPEQRDPKRHIYPWSDPL